MESIYKLILNQYRNLSAVVCILLILGKENVQVVFRAVPCSLKTNKSSLILSRKFEKLIAGHQILISR